MHPFRTNKEESERGPERTNFPPGRDNPLAAAERGSADRKEKAGQGTGVVEATHPSTVAQPVKGDIMKTPSHEKKDPPRQGRQAGEVRVTGCAQKRVSENQCPDVAVDKYVLLEDDVIPHQAQSRSVFICPIHGKLYNERIKDKRRSRPGCWNRG